MKTVNDGKMANDKAYNLWRGERRATRDGLWDGGLSPLPNPLAKERELRRLLDRQSHFHNQSTVTGVRGFDRPVVQVHCAGSDGKPQAGPSGPAIAVVFHSIERSKDVPD
jgi:hypothetical protein